MGRLTGSQFGIYKSDKSPVSSKYCSSSDLVYIIKRCLYFNATNSICHISVEPIRSFNKTTSSWWPLIGARQHLGNHLPLFYPVSLWFALVVKENASSLSQAFMSWTEYLIKLFRPTGSTKWLETLFVPFLIHCCPSFMPTSLSPKGR